MWWWCGGAFVIYTAREHMAVWSHCTRAESIKPGLCLEDAQDNACLGLSPIVSGWKGFVEQGAVSEQTGGGGRVG